MRLTINQNIKQYKLNVNQNDLCVQHRITVAELGKRGFDGRSAYEVWLSLGNAGTPQDFINSLNGGSVDSIKNEIPQGLINGTNNTFTSLENFIPESVEVFLNGLKQQKIIEFQTTGSNTITLSVSPNTNEIVSINYIKS
jgi:hypothetical protein